MPVAEDAPQRQVFQSVLKYTGPGNVPEWMDKERGDIFGFNDFLKDAQVMQISLKRSVAYRRMFLLLRTGQSVGRLARRALRGNSR